MGPIQKDARQSGDDLVLFAHWFLRPDVITYLATEYLKGSKFPPPLIKSVADIIYSDNNQEIAFFLVPEFSDFVAQGIWIFRAKCLVRPVDLQEAFGASILSSSFVPGDFDRSFPDGSELARNLKKLSLEELQKFFQSERDRVGEKVEFPGIKVPAESVAYWGTALIFAITAYLFCVFRDFLRATGTDKAWTVPWIGTSKEIAS